MRKALIAGVWGAAALCGAAAVWGTGLVSGFAALAHPAEKLHFADANDEALVMHGKQLYARNCASCHGRFLQGQPLWQLVDEYAGRRAPAHDQTGHTWQHSDEDLFQFTKYARWSTRNGGLPPTATPYMPAFESRLADADIEAIVAFIKRSWPLGLRVSQAMLNPNLAGMPAKAADIDWRLPPTTCRGSAVPKAL